MKKSYITPQLLITEVRCASLIAESIDKYDAGADEGVVLIKGESTSPSRYNVWDDDWSN